VKRRSEESDLLGQAQHPTLKGAGEVLRAEIFIRAKPPLSNVAKHPKRRRRKFRRYLRGSIDEGLQLSTLAARTLISDTWDEVVVERTFISSVDVLWALGQFVPGSGIGPVIVGVAHSDYTDVEIEAVIENAGSWNEGDLTSQEVAKRKIRIIGQFNSVDVSVSEIVTLNDGKPIHTKLNWILTTGDTLKMFAYNAGSAAQTGDARMTAQGFAHLWPQ